MLYLIGIAGFIVALGLAIFIHELGHFLAAKMFGVPVERFVIGFDREAMPFLPRCIIEKKFGETVYGLSLVPIGGYVKMSGTIHPEIEAYLDGTDNDYDPPMPAHGSGDEVKAAQEDPTSAAKVPGKQTLQGQAMQDMEALYKKPFWQKVIIYSAGVIMNMVLAMAVFTFMDTKGVQVDAPLPAKVGWIPAGSPWAAMPIESGMEITALNGEKIETVNELDRKLAEIETDTEGNTTFTLTFAKDGQSIDQEFSFPTQDQQVWTSFVRTFYSRPAWIEYVIPNRPADKAGLKKGDYVVSVNGEDIVDWNHLVARIQGSPDEPMMFTVRRGDELVELEVTPWESADEDQSGEVGIVVGNPDKVVEKLPFLAALSRAPGRVMDLTILYVQNLKKLGGEAVSGNVTAVHRELGGPVGIAQLAYRQAQSGLDDWLRFLVLLNVALAVMNILPFPILDGGHICFAAYEGVFKRPVPPKVLVPVLNGAVMFLLVFFVLVTFSDLFKVFS